MPSQFFLCTPDVYYNADFQASLKNTRKSSSHTWVDMIESSTKESVLYSNSHITVCKDLNFSPSFFHLLIFFKKPDLYTFRDIDPDFVPVVQTAMTTVRAIAARFTSQSLRFYFNYLPSTYQLHIHVVSTNSTQNTHRCHSVSSVLRNICRDPNYYKRALILTRLSNNNAMFKHYARTQTSSRIELEFVKALSHDSAPAKPNLPASNPATQNHVSDNG